MWILQYVHLILTLQFCEPQESHENVKQMLLNRECLVHSKRYFTQTWWES